MAGDWIKVEYTTPDKPEALKMAEVLGINPDEVAGKLFRVWCWFDSQSLDGHAGSVTGVTLFKFIDRLVALQGFAATMKLVGWLSDTGMPNFDYHNGESSKKRALNAKRQKKHRNVSVTPEALPEKRREEKKEKHIRARKIPLPENFGLSERVIEWAKAKGYGSLQAHLDAFRLKAVASDYHYADWDAAFMEAIRADWAKVNGKGNVIADQFARAM